MYNTQIQNELGKTCSWPTQTRNHYLLASTKSMTGLIHIGVKEKYFNQLFYLMWQKWLCFHALGV